MVSLLIKKHDFAVFFTKTHHLKTLYMMPERMTSKAFGPSKLFLVLVDMF